MKTFQQLYEDLLRQKVSVEEPLPKEYDPKHLDCLLYPLLVLCHRLQLRFLIFVSTTGFDLGWFRLLQIHLTFCIFENSHIPAR